MTENEEPNKPQSWLTRQWNRLRNLPARDVVIGQVGEGATNVIIGKNNVQINVAGYNITPYVLVIMLAVLVLVGYQVYPQVEPLWNPWPMSGGFNVAVADFGLLDTQGRMHASEFGSILSRSLAAQMGDAYQALKTNEGTDSNVLIWDDGVGRAQGKNVRFGSIQGTTPAERSAAAKALARRIRADMVIYGYLTTATDPESLVLEFYYDAQARAGDPDLMWGSYELGAPLAGDVSYADNPETAKRTLLERLGPRTHALFRMTQAWAELLANHPDQATRILQATVREFPDETWPRTAGKEVLYWFIGGAASVAREFDLAIEALEEALRINPDYVPALLALGSVYLDRAQLFSYRTLTLTPEQAACVSIHGVEQSARTLQEAQENTRTAIRYVERAAALAPNNPYWQPFVHRAHMILGLAYRLEGLWQFNLGDIAAAETAFSQADQESQQALAGYPREEQPVYYAWTQVNIGAVARMRAHLSLQQAQEATTAQDRVQADMLRAKAVDQLQQAIDHYQACIDLRKQTAGNLIFQKRVLECSCVPFQANARQVLSDTLEVTP